VNRSTIAPKTMTKSELVFLLEGAARERDEVCIVSKGGDVAFGTPLWIETDSEGHELLVYRARGSGRAAPDACKRIDRIARVEKVVERLRFAGGRTTLRGQVQREFQEASRLNRNGR
jgi:hypothetical protein